MPFTLRNIKALPERRPGVYYFYDKHGNRIYTGSAAERGVKARLEDTFYSVDGNETILVKQSIETQTKIARLRISEFVDSFYKENEDNAQPIPLARPAWCLSAAWMSPGASDLLQLGWRRIQAVFRHKLEPGEKLLRFSTGTGRSVAVTKGHSLMIFKQGRIVSFPAKELKREDMLIIPRVIPALTSVPSKTLPFTLITGRQKVKIHQRNVPVDDKLMRLLGFFVSDGSYMSSVQSGRFQGLNFDFGLQEEHLFNQLNEACLHLFGAAPKKKYPEDKKAIRGILNSAFAQAFLEEGLHVSRGAHNKSVPDVVWNAPADYQRIFMQGLWDGDRGATVSPQLASDMLYLTSMSLDCSGSIDIRHEKARFRGLGFPYRPCTMYHLVVPPPNRAEPYRRRFELGPPIIEVLKVFDELVPFRGTGLHKGQDDWVKHWRNGPRRHATERDIRNFCMTRSRRLLYERLSAFGNGRQRWWTTKELTGAWGMARREQVSDYLRKSPILETNMLQVRGRATKEYQLDDSTCDIMERIRFTMRACSSNRGVDFDIIEKITEVEPSSSYVYDLIVPETECFIAGFGGILVHNSRGDYATIPKKRELRKKIAKVDIQWGKNVYDNREIELKQKQGLVGNTR